ncbi:MAG: CARDB domain-containing protein, partial [Candidatus Paceibacterales bacterium]
NNKQIDFYPDPPAILGDQTITAIVDPENKIEELNEANNENSTEITVKDISGLYLVYFPVDRPITYFGYDPINMEEYSETVSQSGKFISATYPAAEGEFTNQKSDEKYNGSPVPFLGMINDAIGVWIKGELLTKTLADRSIGIVPDDYFGYHLRDISGKFFPYIPAVLVENGDWTATAHEIGHTYNLDWPQIFKGPGEEYETNPPWGNPASGFWVNEKKEIYPLDKETMKGGICFMGPAGTKHSFNYDTAGWMPIWIDNEDYGNLFKEFRINKTDPPDVLLASGLIFQDGKVELKKWYRVENGIIDEDIISGDYSIQISDIDGQTLVNIPFKSFFEMYIDPATGIETGVTGFAFTIPYPEDTSKIQIQYNDETLIEIDPNTKLLHDAVDLIPDYGFVKNPEQRKNALHHKIEAVERMIDRGNFKGAVNKLEHDIKDKIEKWLVDYQKEEIEQFSKVEIIELVDEIIYRLSLMIEK